MKRCTIEGCDRTHRARGWCGMHYERWRRNGDPTALNPREYRTLTREEFAESFWRRVNRTGECWGWQSETDAGGYGRVYLPGGGSQAAHRTAWELSYGPIPGGLYVCHHCDNRSCVRPDHLFLGTHQDNMDDMVRKGRSPRPSRPGSRNPQAKLTESDVRDIFVRVRAGETHKSIAADFGVSRTLIGHIVGGRAWTHVEPGDVA